MVDKSYSRLASAETNADAGALIAPFLACLSSIDKC